MENSFKSYLITDPAYYTNNPTTFAQKLQYVYENHSVAFACFRDKASDNIWELAKLFVDISIKNSIKNIYINSDINLAISLNATGVHLPSNRLDDIQKAKNASLKVIYSTHNHKEIEDAIKKGADYITYSPIFYTPNKKKPKGIQHLIKTVDKYDIDIFALGGIVDKITAEDIKKSNAFGFASIRYFIDN
jgi:thiamine-phosphate pyrophosphorylase